MNATRSSLPRALRLPLLALAVLLAFLVSVRAGSVSLSLAQVLDALRGLGDPAIVTIVQRLRLPRAVTAALVGAALALSGATFQALVRNPLADPYVLGVSGGAALGAVCAIVLGSAAGVSWAISLAAFAGAALTIVLVLRLALAVGPTLDTRVLLLAGVIVGAFTNSCILLLLTFADLDAFRSATFWMMGSLSGATWRGAAAMALYIVPSGVLLLGLARSLDLIAIGEETAAHLGTHVERTKLLAYGAASLLAAASVASAGIIGFVGLVVPHGVRLAWGSDHRTLLPASMLAGAAFLLLADTVARTVAAPSELPLGAVTALIGVPLFVNILRRGRAR